MSLPSREYLIELAKKRWISLCTAATAMFIFSFTWTVATDRPFIDDAEKFARGFACKVVSWSSCPQEVAWEAIKNSKDLDATLRYISEFPESPFFSDAETIRDEILQNEVLILAETHALGSEADYWKIVQSFDSVLAYRSYIERFPYGRYRTEADEILSARQIELSVLDTAAFDDAINNQGKTGETTIQDCMGCPEMVQVNGGQFSMGTPLGELARSEAEGPKHVVSIGQPFFVSKYEITNEQWQTCVTGGGCRNLSTRNQPNSDNGELPVTQVSWDDAVDYVSWLSASSDRRYRLLSEAEWEYAARAGSDFPFSFGTTISPTEANFDGRVVYGTGFAGEYRGGPLPVGSFAANSFGLYDMHGNVAEWVADCWTDNYVSRVSENQTTGVPWRKGACVWGVMRGGSWADPPEKLRSGFRAPNPPQHRSKVLGFRVARDP